MPHILLSNCNKPFSNFTYLGISTITIDYMNIGVLYNVIVQSIVLEVSVTGRVNSNRKGR